MNICLHFVQIAQTYKIMLKTVDFFNSMKYNVGVS